MAAQHSITPAFLVFPTLNPTLTWRVAAVSTNRTISLHRNLELAIRKAERMNVVALLHEAVKSVCEFEDERYEFACGKKAVACDRETGKGLCAGHVEVICG
jgi:hypothetical protein